MFLRNCWYAAAWSHEVGEAPLARSYLGEPVALFRTPGGTPVALEDRCCHRALPLSMGRVVGETLQCGYHGLRFDATGACVEVPGQRTVPPGAAVRSYPLVERYRLVWIWMGDAARADEALLPDWWRMDHPDWKVVEGGPPFHVEASYELFNDNLLDLSHVAFIHGSSIGTGALADFPITTERGDGWVRMARWVMDSPPAPLYREMGGFTGNVDRWQIADSRIPSINTVHVGVVVPGTPPEDALKSGGLELYNKNAITPETEKTSHYFYAHTRGFRLDDAELDETFRTEYRRVFSEDIGVLAAQQASLDREPGRAPIDINVDGPALAFRRMLAERIAAERRAARGAEAAE